MLVVAFLILMAAILLALATRKIVLWEEALTDADDSVLAEWLMTRRQREPLES